MPEPELISLVDASEIPTAAGFGPGDHLLASIGGKTRRIPLDGLLAAFGGVPTNTRTFNLASRAAVLGFAATTPSIGTVATDPYADYSYLGTGTAIGDLAGWAPKDVVTPWHMGGDPTGATDSAEALREADAYVAANEGKVLAWDGPMMLASSVSLRSRHVIGRGVINVPATFDATAGYVLRLGENAGLSSGHLGRHVGEYFFNAFGYCGRAASTWRPTSGVFPSTGFEGASIKAGDSYKVIDEGTVGGLAFDTTHRLVALIDNPSTTVADGNWSRRTALAMLDVRGLALPFPHIRAQGIYCDRVLQVEGNSEKARFEVAGYGCHSIAHEQAFEGSTPENNSYFVRGNAFGEAYTNEGTVVSDVELETQTQLSGYELRVVSVRATRTTSLSGTIRTPYSSAVLVDQNPATENTGVQFRGLSVVNPRQTDIPWLHVENTRTLTGSIGVTQPYAGVLIRQAGAVDLDVMVDNQKDGEVYRLGRTSTGQTVTRGRVRFTVNSLDAAVSGGRIERMTDLVVENAGICKGITVLFGDRSKVIVPVRAIIDAGSSTPVTRPDGVDMEFVGTDYAAQGQVTNKSTSVTVNALTGLVTTSNETMSAGETKAFTVNNNRVERGDHVTITTQGPTDEFYQASVSSIVPGAFRIALRNGATGSKAHAVPISFEVRKGSRVS